MKRSGNNAETSLKAFNTEYNNGMWLKEKTVLHTVKLFCEVLQRFQTLRDYLEFVPTAKLFLQL